MINPGKLLTQPLFVLLVLAFVGYVLLWRSPVAKSRREKSALLLIGGSLVLLWVLSMPVSARFLERTLEIDGPSVAAPPEAIVVLSGGYAHRGDALSSDTIMRVLAAVEWWRRVPEASFVVSGETPLRGGASTDTGQMERLAVALGVPQERIITENRSRKTMEHPVEVARLPGIDRTTRIGLVTSGWHMRRAAREFERHFDTVIRHGRSEEARPMFWGDWLPRVEGLSYSTKMIHDWIGLAWYGLLHAVEADDQR